MEGIQQHAQRILADPGRNEVESFFVGSITEMIISRYAEDESFPIDQNMLELLAVAENECRMEADAQNTEGRSYLIACTELIKAIQAEVGSELQAEHDKERDEQRALRKAQAEQKEEKVQKKKKWWKSF